MRRAAGRPCGRWCCWARAWGARGVANDRRLAALDRAVRNLAFRNLTRAKMVKLATGQQMAIFLKGKGANLTKLTNAQIRNGNNGADIDSLTQAQRDAFLKTRRGDAREIVGADHPLVVLGDELSGLREAL